MIRRQPDHRHVQLLYETAKELSESTVNDEQKFTRWIDELQNASPGDLVELTGKLASREDSPTRKIKALREAVIAEIEHKSTQDIVETMNKLDASAAKLNRAFLILTVVGVVLSTVQVVQALVR